MADQNEKAGVERRRHRRFPGEAIGDGLRPHILLRGKLRDISQSGSFVETRVHFNLPRFSGVEVRFTANGQRLSALARVMVLRAGKGAGFEFLAADPRLDQDLQRLIERLDVAERVKP